MLLIRKHPILHSITKITLCFLVYRVVTMTSSELLLPSGDSYEHKFESNLSNLTFALSNFYTFFTLISFERNIICENILMSRINDQPHIVFNNKIYNIPIPGTIIILLIKDINSFSEVLTTIEEIDESVFKKQLIFVLCSEVKRFTLQQHIFDVLWSHNIINFVIIYTSGSYHVITFNPFSERRVLDLALENSVGNFFPDKIRNLNLHRMNVSMFEDFPRVFKYGKLWLGSDVRLLETFMFMLNASLEIVESPSEQYFLGALPTLLSGESNFCFISHFMVATHINNLFDFTYPHRLDKLVMLVPRPEKISHYFGVIFIFDFLIWAFFIGCLLGLPLIIACASKFSKRSSYIELIMISWCIFLGLPVKFERTSVCFKFIMMAWIFISCILATAFRCSLTSILISDTYYKHPKTIEEVRDSNMRIYTDAYFSMVIPEEMGLHEKFIITNGSNLTSACINLEKDTACVITESFVKAFFEMHNKFRGSVKFFVVEETLVPGFNVFFFQRNSPFLEKFKMFQMLDSQFGISKRKQYLYVLSNEDTVQEAPQNVVYSLRHLQPAMFLLFAGYLVSVAVFLGELVFLHS